MVREIKEIDGMKCEVWTCQSATERDQQLGVYQNPPPSTHVAGYKWLNDMQYVVGLRPKPQALVTYGPGPVTTGAPFPAGAVPVTATASPLVAGVQGRSAVTSLSPAPTTAAEPLTPAHPFDAPAADLAKMKRDDLRTLATQESIDLEGFLKANKQASNVQAAAFVKDAWEAKKAGK